MFKPDKRLQKLYDKYNKTYWDNRLPKNTVVGYSDAMPEDDKEIHLGQTTLFTEDDIKLMQYNISLNKKLSDVGLYAVKLTLLHEMTHLSLQPYDKHGKRFQEEMLRLACAGAMKEIW